jgi:hypothetical protein
MTVKMAIGIASSKIDISDGARKGGHVRSNGGQRVLWEADATVAKFDLEFARIAEGDGSVDSLPDWPFVTTIVQPNTAVVDEFAGKVTGATKFAGRLANDPGIYKYGVKVAPVAPNPQPPALDPMIIIDK